MKMCTIIHEMTLNLIQCFSSFKVLINVEKTTFVIILWLSWAPEASLFKETVSTLTSLYPSILTRIGTVDASV